MRRKFNLLTAFLLLLGFLAKAQETTSEIQGTVTDNTASPLAGATVVALHQPTGTKYSTTTRKDGRFNLPNLRIGGPYLIQVSYVGFREEKQENITLLLGQEFKANFKMSTSLSTLSEVVVSGSRQDKVFNNNRTGSQETISRNQIERLPTISRSIQDFTKLEPTANGLNIGGRSSQYNNITVDGANFNNSFGLAGTLGGQTGAEPISLESIEQIQVSVAPYDVTQGGFSGAGVNTVTKSGTNQFRGSVYTALKGPGTQGYKVGTANIPKTDFSFNTRGFSLGGPIIKDKLFFFVNGEQVRQTAPATSIVASDATHAPSGNIAQANFDTLTALSNFLQTKYDYKPGEFQGYTFKTNSDKITAKLDWNINASNTFTVKYNYLKSFSDQFASNSRPGVGQIAGGQPGTIALPFYGSGYVINNNFNIVIAELNTRFGNKATNKLQAGYTALRDFRSPHSTSSTFPLVDILNGSGQIYTTFGYEMYTYNNLLNTDVFQFADIFKFYKGSHEITVGTQDYYRKYKNAFAPGYQGVYQFNSLTDFYNSANSDGSVANARNYYLQYSALPGGAFPFAFAGSTELGFFAQDKWRASKNFTLTYGLRGDLTIYKQSFTDNPNFDALTFKDGSYNIGKAPKTTPLFSPRLGFNWDIKGDRTIQIRGGAGVFAGPPPFVWISNQASNNGIQFGSFTRSTPPATTPTPTPGNLVAFNPDPTAYIQSGPNTSYSTALTDRNFKYPQVLKASLAVDKKLPKDYILTIEGTYSKDINAVYYQNINLNETNAFSLGGVDNRSRYLTTVANSNKYYFGTTLANPNIGNAILMSNTSKGYSYTITGRVQKTFKNLFASVAYTYSQAKNTAEFGSTASSLWSARAIAKADPNGDNLANAAYYQPNRIIAYASYKFATGKYASTSIGAVFEASQSGVSSYIYNGDLNGDGNTGNDLIYIPKNASEINLVRVNSGGLGTGTGTSAAPVTDTRSGTLGTGAVTDINKSQIWNQLNNFINQDHYLSTHRGQYAQANAVIAPFFKRLDLNITEQISIKTGKERHTLALSMDLINAGNFLNKYWGTYKTPNLSNFLKYEGLGADGKTPSFSMPYLDAANQVPLVNSFKDNTNILSRWQMQFGIRYLFN